ncbi:sigma-70 family RNA polymerase sigma factor [Trinickia diaoshuihuensis]|uniref:sigma-70 family RNA polymerase sigma factor n=1 Tax=Trinickia diaoshuihuensis TaxID=2292265 RepID=UPI000E284F0D|nr:sigma-70 family RNA polymerase sigma factor [Trinickia diaoshuihuensis]
MTQEEIEKTLGFEAARARLISIAYRMLGSRAEAEDVVQDAWLKWHAAAAHELRTPLAWLTTVTTRLAIDRIRRLQSEQTARANEWVTQPWLDEFVPSAEDEAMRAASIAEAVALLLERLSPDERAAFVLHEAFDFDYAQIAEVVGKTAAHCRQLAHRARQRLTNAERQAADGRSRARIEAAQPHVGSFEGLRDAIHAADAAGALRLFAQSAQRPMAGQAVASTGYRGANSGAHSGANAGAARAAAERAVAQSEGVAVEVYALPSDWGGGLALMHACEVVGLVRFAWTRGPSGDWRGQFILLRSGAELDALNRRVGSRAITQLLMRIAGRSPVTAACAA